jgi:regulator of replication initiation timing
VSKLRELEEDNYRLRLENKTLKTRITDINNKYDLLCGRLRNSANTSRNTKL